MTDNTNAGVLSDAVRVFSSFLDRGVYGLLNIVYQVFFNITSVDLFQNEVMMKFYGRIQLILGVFMMFQLAMTVLKGIVDPNSFTDSKTGAGNLVYRVAVSLILLTVLVPISTPGRNEFEKRVNNNGILFGTLYSLQYRILNNNTIGKLVLGTTDDNSSMVSTGNQKNDVEYSSRVFTATILRSFYRINLIEESKRTHVDGKEDEMINANRMCQDIDDATLAAYTKVDAEAGDIVSYVNETCSASGGIVGAVGLGQKRYQFYYMAFVCPIIVVFLSFCVDIAIRSVKLAVLRLIAPIPIISYMDPKGGKDNAFSSWVKTLTSTYLDLFIRLAAVYFVLFVIQDMIYSGVRINTSGGMVGAISFIMIWLGLFIFAKQAPKFIKQAIGLKEDAGGGFFSGLGGLAVGLGAFGSMVSGARASWMADSTNGRSHANPLNLAKNAVAGIAGGITGTSAAIDAYNNAKGSTLGAVTDAYKKHNSSAIRNGVAGSTFLGRRVTGLESLGFGESIYEMQDRKLQGYKTVESTGKDLFNYLEGKGKTDGAKLTASADYRGISVTTTVDEFNKAKSQAISLMRHDPTHYNGDFVINGQTFNVDEADTKKFEDDLVYAAGTEWARGEDRKIAAGQDHDVGYEHKRQTYEQTGNRFTTVSQLKKDFKKAGGDALHLEGSNEFQRRKANYGAKKDK